MSLTKKGSDQCLRFKLKNIIQDYFLPLFDRPKINIVFSNTLKVRSCMQTRFTIQKLFFREKETKHRFCLKCRFCFRFSTLLLFTYDKYKNKIHIYNKFSSILLVRLAPQPVNHTSLKNLEILFKNAVFTYLNTSRKYSHTPLYPF